MAGKGEKSLGREDEYGQVGLLKNFLEQIGFKELFKNTVLLGGKGEQVDTVPVSEVLDPAINIIILN